MDIHDPLRSIELRLDPAVKFSQCLSFATVLKKIMHMAAGLNNAGRLEVAGIDHDSWRKTIKITLFVGFIGDDMCNDEFFFSYHHRIARFQLKRR